MLPFANRDRFSSDLVRALVKGRAELGAWRKREEERAQLARMTEAERHDIGVTRTDVLVEANKPCWRK